MKSHQKGFFLSVAVLLLWAKFSKLLEELRFSAHLKIGAQLYLSSMSLNLTTKVKFVNLQNREPHLFSAHAGQQGNQIKTALIMISCTCGLNPGT